MCLSIVEEEAIEIQLEEWPGKSMTPKVSSRFDFYDRTNRIIYILYSHKTDCPPTELKDFY